MGSIIHAVRCPNCGRSAVEDYDYKMGEKTIVCYRCGYFYSRKRRISTTSMGHFTEEQYGGYGVFSLQRKRDIGKVVMFDREISQGKLQEFQNEFSQANTDQENSLLVTYEKGIFTIHCGTPTENFHLPFEQYKIKMLEKYGDNEDNRHIVPIEG